ncbi:RNA polymerase sigma factor [Streptomyces sp. NPDC001675]
MAEHGRRPHVDAVAALVEERYGQVVGYARKRLRALDVPPAWMDAEDVVNSALTCVLARSEPVEKLRPYVFAVIKNEASNAARRYRSGLGYGSRDADVQLAAADAVVDPCGAVEQSLDLGAALRALPQQQRTAVLATKALGLSQWETARVMGKSPGTVATHVSRAMVALRTLVGALVLVLMCRAAYFVYLLWAGGRPIEPASGRGSGAFGAVMRPILGSPVPLAVWVGGVALSWMVLRAMQKRDRMWRAFTARLNSVSRDPVDRGDDFLPPLEPFTEDGMP